MVEPNATMTTAKERKTLVGSERPEGGRKLGTALEIT
jgi:hypothetical protein